jgi:hypothetical protein
MQYKYIIYFSALKGSDETCCVGKHNTTFRQTEYRKGSRDNKDMVMGPDGARKRTVLMTKASNKSPIRCRGQNIYLNVCYSTAVKFMDNNLVYFIITQGSF